jgi:hypothetical protein
VVHGIFTSKCRRNAPYPDIHTGTAPDGQTAAHFRDSSLVSARDLSLPRVARFEHQARGLVFVYSAAVFVAAVYGEAGHHPL